MGERGKQKLGDLSNENTYAINKLKEAQAEAAKEKDAVYKEIHTINIQEKKDEDPKGYASSVNDIMPWRAWSTSWMWQRPIWI